MLFRLLYYFFVQWIWFFGIMALFGLIMLIGRFSKK